MPGAASGVGVSSDYSMVDCSSVNTWQLLGLSIHAQGQLLAFVHGDTMPPSSMVVILQQQFLPWWPELGFVQ